MSTVLPPAPNWFSAQILRCSDDGHLAFGARHQIVILRCEPKSHFAVSSSSSSSSAANGGGDSIESAGKEGSDCNNWRRSPTPTTSGLSPSDRIPPGVHINTTAFSVKAKITAVCWSPDSLFVAATSDDGHVRILKVDDDWSKSFGSNCVQVHTMHKDIGKDRHKVNTVSWSRPNPDLVVSGDELGNLVMWDVKSNTTRSVNFGKHNVFVLETHPYTSDVVAFGCRLGLAFVVNITGSGKIIQKIRGHDEDIQGLSWCPSKFREVFNDKSETSKQEESLLSLSSRDKTITIWSAKTGEQLAHIRLPGGAGSKGKVDSKMSWTTCFWWKPNILLSSGVHGELLEWNLSRLTKRTPDGMLRADGQSEMRIVHREHARTLYSIHTTGASIQSSGQDRAIMSFHWESHTLDFNLPAFAAWVYTIAPNCVDPSVIAIGAGDAQIRVWKMKSNKAMFEVNTIWQKLNSAKVTALAWHPDKESTLAFGTDEGRVGLLDAFSNRSVPTFCDFKHRSTVYNLCFGPAVGSAALGSGDHKDLKKMLYSCGDGQVMMHSTKQDGNKTINVDDVITASNGLQRKPPSRSDMMFQPYDYKFMVIGSDDGVIEIFTVPRMEMICVLKSFQKLVQSLAWHPNYVGASPHPSTHRHWLATASNESDIHVWDLGNQLESVNNTSASEIEPEKGDAGGIITSPILTTPTVILSGHHSRVIYLNWSPHEEAKLVSVSYDCTAQVWDAAKGVPICNFSGHTERLFCGMWSPVDPDVIFTGGEDSAVFGWKVSEQQDKLPAKKTMKKISPKVKVREAKDSANDSGANDALTMLEAKRRELMMEADVASSVDSAASASDCREATTELRNSAAGGARRKQKKRAYFPLSFAKENNSKASAYDDCQKLYEFLYGEDGGSTASSVGTPPSSPSSAESSSSSKPSGIIDRLHLGFFADKFAMDNLVDVEKKYLKDQGMDDSASHLSQWSGDIGETIKSAISAGKLNDWLVSMSAGVSYNLWKEACNAYAAQLIRDDEVVKGASYYLMNHNVVKAIEELRNNHFYRAAVTIAKTRLPDNVPLLQELYTAWGLQSSNDGSYELAAKCWIAAGELSQAASLLAKRPDASSLRVSSILALKAGELDKCRMLATQCAALCIKNKDWKCMELLTKEVKFAEICQTWEETKKQIQSVQQPPHEDEGEEESQPSATSSPKSVAVNNGGVNEVVKEEDEREETLVTEDETKDNSENRVNI